LTKEFSITQTVLSTLTQILKGSDDFDLGITLHTIWIRTENCTLWFSRPAGTPPDYQRALPKKATTRLVVSADELMVAARLVSHADGNMVLIVSDGTAKVESTHSDIRVNLQLQNCEPIAEMRTIVNPRYLVQALQNVGADKVIVKQNDSLEPLVLLPRVEFWKGEVPDSETFARRILEALQLSPDQELQREQPCMTGGLRP